MQEGSELSIPSGIHLLHQSQALTDRKLRVRVVGAWRYPVDDAFYKSVAERRNQGDEYAFDVEVCDEDESSKTKCVVLPKFNEFVQRGGLECGKLIEIERWKLCYDEAVVGGENISILVEISSVLVDERELAVGDLSTVPWWNGASEREIAFRPLAGQREYYLDLWNNEDPLGERWNTVDRQSFVVRGSTEAKLLLSGRIPVAKLRLASEKIRPVCGCVVEKHRLLHYGLGKNRKFPFQFSIVLKDESGCVEVTLWDTLCGPCFRSIHLGDIISCHIYRVKRKYVTASMNQTQCPSQGKADVSGVELSLNPVDDPTDAIRIFPLETLSDQLRIMLPSVPFDFVNCCDLAGQPSGGRSTCDVVGMVVYAGPWERTRYLKQRPNASLPELAQSRLVGLRDATWPWPVMLRIYALSDPDVFHYIHPGCLLVCTQCILTYQGPTVATSHASNYDRRAIVHLLLTTSRRSQIFMSKFQSKLSHMEAFGRRKFLVCQRPVRSVAQWADGLSEQELAGMIVDEDGHELDQRLQFPPLPSSIDGMKLFLNKNNIELTASVELGTVFDALQYRERRLIFLQATVADVSVSLHKLQSKNSNKATISTSTSTASSLHGKEQQQVVAEGGNNRLEERGETNHVSQNGQKNNHLGQAHRRKRHHPQSFTSQLLSSHVSSDDEGIELQGFPSRKRKQLPADSGHETMDSEYTATSTLCRLSAFDYIQSLSQSPTISKHRDRSLLPDDELRAEDSDGGRSVEFLSRPQHGEQESMSPTGTGAQSAPIAKHGANDSLTTGLREVVGSVAAHADMERNAEKMTLQRSIEDSHGSIILQTNSTLSYFRDDQVHPDINWSVTFLLNNGLSMCLPLLPRMSWESKLYPIDEVPADFISALRVGCAPQAAADDQDTTLFRLDSVLDTAESELRSIRFLVVLDAIRQSVDNIRVSLLRTVSVF